MRVTKTDLDLETSRVIKAPPSPVWNAWADPDRVAQWWIPKPATCRVIHLDLQPGGAFTTEMNHDGGRFEPHLSARFLDAVWEERIIFTNALTGGRLRDGCDHVW